jgi:anaerobic magnesium-protoporphyrin IX monomethyl ester cyclase
MSVIQIDNKQPAQLSEESYSSVPGQLDLLFINPSSRVRVYQALGSELAAIEPPVWIGLIATFMKDRGCSVKILDAEAESLGPDEVAERVCRLSPRLVAVIVYGQQPSASTQNMTASGEVCKAIKLRSPDQKILMGGLHPSALPERTMREEAVDFVCQGEGPYTILGLLRSLESKRSADYSGISGLWYRDGLTIRSTPPAPVIDDLDKDLHGVAWDLLPMERYRAHNWHCFGRISERQPYASMYTSLGCPFKCSFCCINAPFGKPMIRYRSPASVVREIDELVTKYGVRNIKMADEMFILNERQVIGICDRLIERGYDLNIWAYARIDTVKDSMLSKLKKAGFNWLGIGIESASTYVRDGVDKSFGKKDIREIFDKVRSAEINIGANFIFGLPDDTKDTMQETLDMAIDLCPDWANFYSAMAYPGSKLYEMAVEKNLALPETWIGFSQHAYEALPLPTDHVSAGQVLSFRDRAFHTFFEHPRYLAYIEKKFGVETVDHIKQMTQHRLKRKYAA